jgi:uncharacterized membrane protein YidH (DUF202 family)
LAGHLLLHCYDPDHLTQKRVLIIDGMIAADWYGDAISGSGNEQSGRRAVHMKPKMIIGIVLIALGVGVLAYQGITYTSREKIIDFGPIQATLETNKTIPLSPILGGVALAGGIVLVIIGIGAKK